MRVRIHAVQDSWPGDWMLSGTVCRFMIRFQVIPLICDDLLYVKRRGKYEEMDGMKKNSR